MAGHVVAGAAAASRAAKRAKPLPPPSLEAEAARKQSLALVTMQYKNWDVVWARMTGFPWWPGVVFHGWDVVEAAGLPLPRDPPVLAPPEKREVVVTGAGGKLERRIVVDRSCLVMFLDKGDWSALNMNTQVMPFTLGYAANSKPTHKRAKTSGFRLALQRALRLIHTSNECSSDDLAMLNAPPTHEKKPKRQRVTAKARGKKHESDWDDDVESSENDDNDDNDDDFEDDSRGLHQPKLPGKKPTAAQAKLKRVTKPSPKGSGKASAKSSAVRAKKAPVRKPKKKAAVDSDSDSDNDNDNDSDSDSDDVEFVDDFRATTGDSSAGENDSGSSVPAASTPLSHIWTEHVEQQLSTREPSLSAMTAASGATKTLVYKQDFVWDDALFTSTEAAVALKPDPLDAQTSPARDRPLGKRQMRSVQQSHIRQNLMMGNLDPHTMVQCESYRSPSEIETPGPSRGRNSTNLEQPFRVQVHPDAAFVCDLHAHLATCEIIGFLGGRWNEETKTLSIQAAFPCRSLMIDGDDGSTDVEMDPGSEIELREIIQNAELEVVGWYHSHPAFAPDPSIRDIENQTSYQQLFQRRTEHWDSDDTKPTVEISEPFVGLIVGTYDTKRDTPVSLFRYFHTRSEKVSGGARREIHMPYELVPTRRQYRSVVQDKQRAEIAHLSMYPSVFATLFGPQTGAARSRSASLPVEFAEIDASVSASRSSTSDNTAPVSTRPKKRKQSADVVVEDESDVKKIKGRRERPRVANPVVVDLSQPTAKTEPDDSAAQATAALPAPAPVSVAGDASEPIVVDADDSVAVESSHPRAAEVVVVDLSSLPASAVAELPEPAAKPASPDGSGSSQASSTVSGSGAFDGVNELSSGRRRERKPMQTQRKVTVFASTSKKPDEQSKIASIASQIAVYGAFGTVGVGSTTMPDKTSGRVSPTTPIAVISPMLPVKVEDVKVEDVVVKVEVAQADNEKPTEPVGDATQAADDVGDGEDGDSDVLKVESRDAQPGADDSGIIETKAADIATTPMPIIVATAAASADAGAVADVKDEFPAVGVTSDAVAVGAAVVGVEAEASVVAVASAVAGADAGVEAETSAVAVKSAVAEAVIGAEDEFPAAAVASAGVGAEAESPVPAAVAVTTAPVATVNVHEDVVAEDSAVVDAEAPAPAVAAGGGDSSDTVTVAARSELDDAVKDPTNDGEEEKGRATIETTSTPAAASQGDDDAVKAESSEVMVATDAASVVAQAIAAETASALILVPAAPTAAGVADGDNAVKAEPDEAKTAANDSSVDKASTDAVAVASPVAAVGSDDAVADVAIAVPDVNVGAPSVDDAVVLSAATDDDKPTVPADNDEAMPAVDSTDANESKAVAATAVATPSAACQTPDPELSDHPVKPATDAERQEAHLLSLRTKYGRGVSGCAEQAITLVDYYSTFERRIDLTEPWKARMSKLSKIEASMAEYVRYVNVPVHLRQAYVEDVTAYLELSWRLARPGVK